MCFHREHRTGNCRECQPLSDPAKFSPRDESHPYLTAVTPAQFADLMADDMPDRWDGDDS